MYPWRSICASRDLLKPADLGVLDSTAQAYRRDPSALLEGVPSKVVQEMLGHAKISQTIDTYYHVLLTGQADVARKLDSPLF